MGTDHGYRAIGNYLRRRWLSFFPAAVLLTAGEAGAGILIGFQQDVYQVLPGAMLDVPIVIDGNDATPELDAVAHGLFSFGAKATFATAKATADAVKVVDELNFVGFDDGAETALDAGLAAAKGNIDLASGIAYDGNLLMTVSLTNIAPASDYYALEADFYRTLGPQEQLFIDGTGELLDGDITFGSATVQVIPEPVSLVLVVSGVGLYWPLRTRRRRSNNGTTN